MEYFLLLYCTCIFEKKTLVVHVHVYTYVPVHALHLLFTYGYASR